MPDIEDTMPSSATCETGREQTRVGQDGEQRDGGMEIETADGWQAVSSEVVSLGGGRYRATLLLPGGRPIARSKLRFRGQVIRSLAKTTILSPRRGFDTLFLDFSVGS